MQLTAQDLALINYSLNQIAVSENDKASVREVCTLLMTSIKEEEGIKKFVDGEVDLSTMQKAMVIKALKGLSWTKPQWDAIDELVSRLN